MAYWWDLGRDDSIRIRQRPSDGARRYSLPTAAETFPRANAVIARHAAVLVFAVAASACRRAPKATDVSVSVPLPKRSEPDALCVTSDGALWITLSGTGSVLRIDPMPPYRTRAVLLESTSRPRGMAVGPDGALWFVEEVANRIGRIQAEWPYTLVEYDIPDRYAPVGIASGPDRAMWFIASALPRLGRIAIDSPHDITEITTPGPGNGQWSPRYGIAVTSGPNETVWFTAVHGVCWVHTARLNKGVQCRAASPRSYGFPGDLVRASDGAVWHTVFMEGVERQDLATGGEIFPLVLGREPGARLAADTRGHIWATSGDGLWEIPVSDPSKAICHPLSRGYRPGSVAVAPDGRVWFIDAAACTLEAFRPQEVAASPSGIRVSN